MYSDLLSEAILFRHQLLLRRKQAYFYTALRNKINQLRVIPTRTYLYIIIIHIYLRKINGKKVIRIIYYYIFRYI